MRAELVDKAGAALGVAEGDELLAEDLRAHRRAVGFGDLAGKQHRHPVAPHQLAHRGAGPGAYEQLGGFSVHSPDYSTLAPESRTSSPHFAFSARTKAANSSGDADTRTLEPSCS